jgi:hypothetical protein
MGMAAKEPFIRMWPLVILSHPKCSTAMAFFISSSLKTKFSLSSPHTNKTPKQTPTRLTTFLSIPAISRRDSLLLTILPLGFLSLPVGPSLARERRNRKTILPEEYNTSR